MQAPACIACGEFGARPTPLAPSFSVSFLSKTKKTRFLGFGVCVPLFPSPFLFLPPALGAPPSLPHPPFVGPHIHEGHPMAVCVTVCPPCPPCCAFCPLSLPLSLPHWHSAPHGTRHLANQPPSLHHTTSPPPSPPPQHTPHTHTHTPHTNPPRSPTPHRLQPLPPPHTHKQETNHAAFPPGRGAHGLCLEHGPAPGFLLQLLRVRQHLWLPRRNLHLFQRCSGDRPSHHEPEHVLPVRRRHHGPQRMQCGQGQRLWHVLVRR